MNRFYVYCSTNQAYEALTFNDILCTELKRNSFRVSTISFMADRYVFLSAEKVNARGRFCGVSEEDNQYPVVFEVTIPDEYTVNGRFLVQSREEGYSLMSEILPVSDFGKTDDCLGVFIFGHIPISFVSGIIFENRENMERFVRSGPELWFPRDIFSTWADEPYCSLPQKTINIDWLSSASHNVGDLQDHETEEEAFLCLQRQIHSKTAAFLAIEATKEWRYASTKANVDSAIISMLDAGTNTFKNAAEAKLCQIADLFQLVDTETFEQKDQALEDPSSEEYKLLHLILDEIAKHGFRLDKDVINSIKEQLSPDNIIVHGLDIIRSFELSAPLEAISTYAGSRIGNAENMLAETKANDILYALALCVKNKGRIDLIRLETAEMSQIVRRYAFIIAGMTGDMADISGNEKSNRPLDKTLGDIYSHKFSDDSAILVAAKSLAQEDYGIDPQIAITVDEQEFRQQIQDAEYERNYNLYKAEFSDIPEKEVSAFAYPVTIEMDGKTYTIQTPDDAEAFKKELDKKVGRKTSTKFSKALFLKRIFEKEEDRLREVYDKYHG